MKAARTFITQTLCIIVTVVLNLGFVCLPLGCASSTVRVVDPDTAAFQQLLSTELAADARRPAHQMEQRVTGGSSDKVGMLDDAKLPEAYTLEVGPSIRPAEYHLGYAARRLIREHYASARAGIRALENDELVEIVDDAGGNVGMVHDFDRDRHVDIADIDGRSVFELVPPGQAQRAEGKRKVDWHLFLINQGMLGVPTFRLGTEYHGEIGVRFAENTAPWKLTWATTDLGVVQYQWQTLHVEQPTEDACREAYLAHRWRDVAPHEIRRFGRALHEVVERLVQARQTLGRTRAVDEMPMLPGKTMADYLRLAVMWSVTGDGIARLLPIMRRPPLDPRLLGDLLKNGSSGTGSSPTMYPGATTPDGIVVPPHPSAPEAYTLDGLFGKMPWQYFMGYSAHRAIAYRYWALHQVLDQFVFRNHVSVATIVKNAGGNQLLLHWSEADLRPDITHVRSRKEEQFVFEIKPEGDVHFAKGKEKLAQYIAVMNRGMAGTSKFFVPGPNDSGELWIMFKEGKLIWRVIWRTTAPGLLQYRWDRPDTKQDEEDWQLREQAWRQAIKDGRWTDISRPEMEAHAEELYLTIEGMMLRREMLFQFRDAISTPVATVGALAEAILSARLWNHIDKTPRVVPVIRTPGPSPQPAVAPKAPAPVKTPPPVNAPSLGSDTRQTPPTTRPLVPGKTPPRTISPN